MNKYNIGLASFVIFTLILGSLTRFESFGYIIICSPIVLIPQFILIWKKSPENKLAKQNTKNEDIRDEEISDIKKEVKRGEPELKIYSEIAHFANVAIVVCNHEKRIEWVNPGFTRNSGYGFDEVIGKKPGEFLQGPLTNNSDIEKFKKGLKSKLPFTTEILNYGKGGNTYTIEAIVSPILDANGDVEKFISIQKDISETKTKTEQLAKIYEDVSSSIRYAKKIQESVLDSFNKFTNHIGNSFVFFEPKDQLSGDFYAIREIDGELFIICGDCTGHGVPAAFMSLIVINTLDGFINFEKDKSPASLLKKTIIRVNEILNPDTRNALSDSFEIAVIKIANPKTIKKQVTIASFRIRIMFIEDGKSLELNLNRNAIDFSSPSSLEYNDNVFETNGNHTLYLWTDGFTDQIGGLLQRKYTRKNLEKFLLSLAKMPIELQEEVVKNEFKNWKNQLPQLDDVTVIGLKL